MAKRIQTFKMRQRAAKQAARREEVKKARKPWIEYLGAETREHISIIQELELQAWFKGVDWEHYPAEGKRDEFNAWLFKLMGGKRNVPDFRIHEARGGFNGFWLEYKKTGTKIFKADGTPYADIKDQWDYLLRMRDKINVKIDIVESPEKAVKAIYEYLQLPRNEQAA